MEIEEVIVDDFEDDDFYKPLLEENYIYSFDEVVFGCFIRRIDVDKLDKNQ